MKDILEQIQKKLDEIEQAGGVRILYAAESGSRAWGFASPDSDYDIRFVYVRPLAGYLCLDAPRDVIEWQLDAVFDINGWDLKKTLLQFAKGNATLFEWSGSPIVYRTTKEWTRIWEVSKRYFSEKSAICHYCGTAGNTLQKYLQGDSITYKKYFYALRPLLAAQYIEHFHKAPPVPFDELVKPHASSELGKAIEELLANKKQTAEKESRPQIPVIQRFIETEAARQKEIADNLPDDHNRDRTALDALFAEIVKG